MERYARAVLFSIVAIFLSMSQALAAEPLEERSYSSIPLYDARPNCMMWVADTDRDGNGDCGEDNDDYMLSFYFGNHSKSASALKSMLRWTSSSGTVSLLLGNGSGRLYEQTAGGSTDNYNIYMCVDDWFGGYLETFRMRKY